MKVRLKTMAILLKEFGFKWNGKNGDYLEYNTTYDGMKWKLINDDLQYLGKVITVYERAGFRNGYGGNYPYESLMNNDKQLWHDKWFAEVIEKDNNPVDVDKDRYLLIMRYFMFVMRNEKLPIKKSDIVIKIRNKGKQYDFGVKEIKDFLEIAPFEYLKG